jgi:hypothetical protein
MYIDPDVDDELRTEAFDSRTSKNDLLRKYLRLGMEAAKKEAAHDVAGKGLVAKRDAGAAKAAGVAKTVAGAVAERKKSVPKSTAPR